MFYKSILNAVGVVVAIMAVMFVGCGSDDDDGGGGNPSVTKGTFTDSRDGKSYKTVKIGTKTWMAENLNYDIPDVNTDVCYDNDPANCTKYGRLYDWETALTACPVGWNLPGDAEWTALTDYVGGSETAGTKLKSKTGWNSYSGVPTGTDNYGFSALPGGGRVGGVTSGGFFNVDGGNGYWWSATDKNNGYAWTRNMRYDKEYVGRDEVCCNKTYLYSVRCVENK
jgi:uncharacterized protein (TIGR02145 family)